MSAIDRLGADRGYRDQSTYGFDLWRARYGAIPGLTNALLALFGQAISQYSVHQSMSSASANDATSRKAKSAFAPWRLGYSKSLDRRFPALGFGTYQR
jgi:hypothetical protein